MGKASPLKINQRRSGNVQDSFSIALINSPKREGTKCITLILVFLIQAANSQGFKTTSRLTGHIVAPSINVQKISHTEISKQKEVRCAMRSPVFKENVFCIHSRRFI